MQQARMLLSVVIDEFAGRREATMSSQREVEERDGRSADQNTRERMLAELPVTERRLQLAGISSAVLEGGDGPPVLLMHGPGEFAALWGRVIPDLVSTHRVVAPDLPGHGATGLPDGPLDHDRVRTWIGELIERTCASPPALVGHLLGGAIAARFASERRDQLSRLVLVDSLGLSWNRTSPRFALPLLVYIPGQQNTHGIASWRSASSISTACAGSWAKASSRSVSMPSSGRARRPRRRLSGTSCRGMESGPSHGMSSCGSRCLRP